MTMTEITRSLKALRLSGMSATLEARALQVSSGDMGFIEAFGALVQDELDRRASRLLERRFALSGLRERKSLQEFDWGFNPKVPKRTILELAVGHFIDAREDILMVGASGTGKSHCAKAIALNAIMRGNSVFYREAHELLSEIHQARELRSFAKLKMQIKQAHLLVIDDLFLRKLPPEACEELIEVIIHRHEKGSTLITSNRPIEDWGKLLGDAVAVSPMLDRIMYHGHLIKFEGKSWRLKEASIGASCQSQLDCVRSSLGAQHKGGYRRPGGYADR